MTIEKRYQVFISSTYIDLQEERREVLKAVLELDHMPAGMELFPATDDSAWNLIKDVIDSSDYYVVIIGGRYGSVDTKNDVSYTEKEYDYAIDRAKPVVPLLHKSPHKIPRDKTDADNFAWTKLEAFRDKIERRHTCSHWDSPDNLKSALIIGLTKTVKLKPAVGWVRADQVPQDADLKEALTLRRRVDELERELENARVAPPLGAEQLAQGDDTFKLHICFSWTELDDLLGPRTVRTISIRPTWNEIFAALAPALINESAENSMRTTLASHFASRARKAASDQSVTIGPKHSGLGVLNEISASCSMEQFQKCLVQLRALGLIRESVHKNRSVKDTETYWTLSPYGDQLMVQLLAQRKDRPDKTDE